MKNETMFKKTAVYFGVFALTLFYPKPISGGENNLRIQELIPEDWIEFPAISPAIPSNYVLGTLNETGHALWGTKEDIAIFTGIESPIESELITLRHSWEVVQVGPTTFSLEKEIEQEFRRLGVKNLKMEKIKWGNYPVLSVEGLRPDGTSMHTAWVGLNSESGATILMNLYLPKNSDNSCPIWKNLLSHTRQLSEPEFFRAMGMDMKEGYTIYKTGSASLKVTVEKRIMDDLLAVMIEPLSPKTTYAIESVDEIPMVTEWKNGEPCTKIYGTMTEKDGKYGTCIVEYVISVFKKRIDNFSFDLDPNNHPEGVVIFKKPLIPRENALKFNP